MRRKLNIAGLFLSALALGVWIGASWHSAAQPLALRTSGETCGSCCRAGASKKCKDKNPQMAPASLGSVCAVCQTGVLVQDAPTAFVPATLLEVAAPETTLTLVSVYLSVPSHTLPPERGPPA